MALKEKLLKARNPLKAFGELDALPYYVVVAEKLEGFLKGKSIAAKIVIPRGPTLLKRASKLGFLGAGELAKCDREKFFAEDRRGHLEEERDNISRLEEKCWEYFYPRKLAEMHYTTNGEGKARALERIYLDVDAKGVGTEETRVAACELLRCVGHDKVFGKLVGKHRVLPMWTGKSFHIYFLLEKKVSHGFYEKYLGSASEKSFVEKWCKKIRQESGLDVWGGHEKKKGKIIIDPSQSPSGKLARAPFSLHLDKRGTTVDGIALPLTEQELCRNGVSRRLEKYNVKKCLKELDYLAKKIPREW